MPEGQAAANLAPWDPYRYLAALDPREIDLSRGFLRSRPEKWFPGFGNAWLPLIHSLGLDLRVLEIKPLATAPGGMDHSYAISFDDELCAVALDSESARVLADAFVPNGVENARLVVLEYLARRFAASVGGCWSGPESSTVAFRGSVESAGVQERGAVKFSFVLNSAQCELWVSLGPLMVETMDGLWRRQIHSSAKQKQSQSLQIEIAQLAVQPSMLEDYTRSGAMIDLEVGVSELVTLRLDGEPWLPARLRNVDGRFGFEVISGPVPTAALPSNTTRLAVEIPGCELQANEIAELSQVGAMWNTGTELSHAVYLAVNQERVASASLCVFEGRFAIQVA